MSKLLISIFTIFLFPILGLSLSSGQGTGIKDENLKNETELNRKIGGCSKQKFKDAELVAYRVLLQSRANAARVEAEKISSTEQMYNERKLRLNSRYLRDLNNCRNDSACTETAKTVYDEWISTAQVDHDDGLQDAQAVGAIATEQAQEDYDAEVKRAKQLYCASGYRPISGPFVTSGVICSFEKPFSLNGTMRVHNAVIVGTYEFVPSSATAGTWSVSASASGSGVTATAKAGGGSYMIEGADTAKPRILTVARGQAQGTATSGRSRVTASQSVSGITGQVDLVPLETDECNEP